ncbi:CYTH domain-containing protein [Leptospira stimsonii]|uniref:CYTH domain-containing protein n=1 Tax=Leptospira stimsonii TaxID=2202203 RepID=A0ABY2N358_9LEPT|nr:CYTH domain-containing protein [Leptospira stimsonii]TGK22036.1 CYTH domain-containing protein [Leptospira stimsonii]TGM14880.1 CYTH domain-containing protein [Leptospira stimsonii]
MEIERKFLVTNLDFKKNTVPSIISQGYLNSDKNRTVRVRINSNKAFITIKSKTVGISREEFEYEIPITDAEEMINSICEKPIIKKFRYLINFQGSIWEVDEFLEENEGLIVAEIELKSENEAFNKPDWVGKEVSDDPKYFNSNLIKTPFRHWNS